MSVSTSAEAVSGIASEVLSPSVCALSRAIELTAASALSGVSENVLSTFSGVFKSSALEMREVLSGLAGPSLREYVLRVQEELAVQFAEQVPAFRLVETFAGGEMARLAGVSRQIASQFSRLGDPVASAALEKVALCGVRSWDRAATAFVERPDAARVFPLEAFGRGTVALGSAVTVLLPEHDVAVHADTDYGLLHSASMTQALRERLRFLSPRILQRLDGAWERVGRRGPDAASQAAHSLMEAIDSTLRRAAPEPAVLAWHAAEGRPAEELNDGHVTRPLRLRWLLRERPGEADAARLYLRALGDLVRIIQSYKHSEDEADIEVVTRLIPTVEGLLIFVLGVSL